MIRPRPTPRRRSLLVAPVLVAALALGGAGCSSDGSDAGGGGDASTTAAGAAPGTGDVLTALADDVLVPAYDDLATQLDGLGTTVADLCAAPSPEALETARTAWQGAVIAWQTTRPGAVGPAMERRIMSAVGFAARPASIDELLASTDPVDEAAMANEGAAERGLYAVEVGLYGEGAATLAAPGDVGARRCTYLTSVVALAQASADEVAADWTDFAGTFAEGMEGDQQTSVAELVNEVTHRLQELDEQGLRDLAAAESLDDLNAARLDGPGAYAMAGRKALTGGIATLVGGDGSGIAALVAARSPETAERLVAAADAVVTAMDALPDSVAAAFELDAEVQAASEAVAALKVVLSTEAASQLGVTINFSDSDGDS